MLRTATDSRKFTRVGTSGNIHFFDGNGAPSQARLHDVSYGGLRLSLGRYIRPQTLLRIPVQLEETQVFFPARVIWCKPEAGNESFRVGLQADHGGKYTMAILSCWVLNAVRAGHHTCGCAPPETGPVETGAAHGRAELLSGVAPY